MDRYIALIHKEKGSSYGIMFPDFPGCVSAADTSDEALHMGREALAFHVEAMRRDGERIPKPRSLEALRRAKEDWIVWQDAIVASVPLLPPKGNPVRININLDENLLAAVDAATKKTHQSRSAFVARALETALEG